MLYMIVDVELHKHSNISSKYLEPSVLYVANSLVIIPWFFRYPLAIMIMAIDLFALVSKGAMFNNLHNTDRAILWNDLANYPGYRSLNKLIRNLVLLSTYSHYERRN